MLLPIAALLSGLLMLAWSGEQFVQGARALARHGRMPPLLVGLVVVGFGHSVPELAVAIWSAWLERPGLALGNAWGAHIVNIGLILAVTALLAPVRLRSQVLRREAPMLLAATALTAVLVADSTLSRADAFVLLAAMGALLVWTVRQPRRHADDALAREIAANDAPAPTRSLGAALLQSLLAAAVLAGGSALLVWGAAAAAWLLGISDLAMGLSVIALGSALPELAACVAAARQGDDDVVLGTVLGAALFNLLAVVGLTAAIAPADIEPQALTRDLPVLAGMTLALFVLARRRGEGLLRRPEALTLLFAYGAYLAWLLATLVPGGGT